MKRAPIILAGLMCLLLLSACQPTPDQGAVINKKDVNNPANNASSIGAPQKWTDTTQYYNGKLTVKVDADVLVPQSQTWPVYGVKLANYSQAEADAIVKALFGDAKLYDQSGATTKTELEKQLLELQLELQQRENGTYTGNSDNSVEGVRQSIESLQQQIQKAPEKSNAKEITSKLTYDKGFDADLLFASAKLGQPIDASIDIRSGRNLPYSENSITFRNGTTFDASYNLKEATGVNMTREEAIQQGDALLEKMGVKGYSCAAVKVGVNSPSESQITSETLANAEKCWVLYYTKSYNGIASTFEDQEGTFGLKDKGSDTPPVYYDRIEIAVNDQGISSLIWHGREQENGVLTDNAALKSFEEIKQSFLNGAKLKYAYIEDASTPNGQSDKWDCSVKRIELGYMRVMSGSGVGSYKAIPVWDFFGTVGPEDENSAPSSTSTIGDYTSLLTINAIDGSIIDRSVGY